MSNRQVFLIVRAYNEAEVLGSTLSSVSPLGYSVVVVDDGSSDTTGLVAKQFPVHYLRHPVNLGPGGALQTGITYALRKGAEILVTFDADGQHPVHQIPALIGPILDGECDVVLGSRFLDPADLALIPRSKRLVLKIGRVVSGLSTGVWLTDTHNGFRAFSRRAAEHINLQETSFTYATELLGQMQKANLCYKEIPSTIRYSDYARRKGQKISNSLNIVLDLVLRKVLK